MDKDRLIRLCLVLYKATESFPQGEPMKACLREKANEILADLILLMAGQQKNRLASQILGNIEVIKACFDVVKEQKWLDENSFVVLEKEYDKIAEEVSGLKEKIKEKAPEGRSLAGEGVKNERHQKILEVLKQKEVVQVKDLQRFFPKLTKRTLRRDFDALMSQGLVERQGEGNMTVYKLC